MVSLRFPTVTSPRLLQPPAPNRAAIAATIAAAAAAAVAGLTLAAKSEGRSLPYPAPLAPLWASLSLADGAAAGSVEPRTGAAFPSETPSGRGLLGTGLRRTSVLRLKSIDVYAYGNPLKVASWMSLYWKKTAKVRDFEMSPKSCTP